MKMKNSFQFLSFLLFSILHLSYFLLGELVSAQNNTNLPFDVGVVLDFITDDDAKKSNISMSMALEEFYALNSFYRTRVIFHARDSKQDSVTAAFMGLDLIENVQVQAIIGPNDSGEAKFMADLGDKSQVPIVSFTATSPSLSSLLTPFFIRTAYNDSAQMNAIAAIVQAFGWREAVPVYENSEYGNGIIPYLVDAFEAINTRIPYRSVISPNASDDQILQELYKLMTMQTRVFIVHMLPSLGSRLFVKAKEIGMMSEGYVWIITFDMTISLSSVDPSVVHSMEGVLGVKPHVKRTKRLKRFEASWEKRILQENPDMANAKLNIYQLWGYDTAWTLAMAAEKVSGVISGSQQTKLSLNISNMDTLRVSQIGLKLREQILNTQFEGLSGEFKLVDGQLQSSVFQIVNVVGGGEKNIGFWTPMNGLLQDLNTTETQTYSSFRDNKLGTIIWPGGSTTVPKGWKLPTNEEKLKIGVPVKKGFKDFVNVTWNKNKSAVTGYCIDVFDAVMEALPYNIPYEYIPFAKSNHTSAGTYNDMVYQVYLQKFDAVVGDTSIIANRSLYIDFTMPYTESGVSMVVPIKDNYGKNAWVFLKPLSKDLWLTTAAFFVFTGFVIWALEQRINDDFRGPLHHQIGMIFWFSFSTMVFSHKEKVISNLARFVLIIWLFVVLILTSSYTASLTSMLTNQQLQPTVTDVQQLLKNGDNVGYQDGSFVLGFLKQMHFDDSKLKIYNTIQELDDGLSKGTANGGFAAAFDEIPYLKLFLSHYCSKYSMVGPTYKTDGFGFVFPRGSLLVSDVSRAVLNITEGDKMTKIERNWFGDPTCPDSSTTTSSASLTLRSFWGLFLITGTISFIGFLAFIIKFFLRYRNVWRNIDHNATLSQRIDIIRKQFIKRDYECFTFRDLGLPIQNSADIMGTTRSPSVISQKTTGNFDQATTSTGTTHPSPTSPPSEKIASTIEFSNQAILQTYESSEGEEDTLNCGLKSWAFSRSEYGLPPQKVWEVISTAMLPPRVKNFLWRACENRLAVKENLLRLNMVDDDLCPLCGLEAESVAHALFYCQVSKRLWFGSSLSIIIPDEPELPVHEWILQWSSSPNFAHQDGQMTFASKALICREIWKYRNRKVSYSPQPLDQWFQVLNSKISDMNQVPFSSSDSTLNTTYCIASDQTRVAPLRLPEISCERKESEDCSYAACPTPSQLCPSAPSLSELTFKSPEEIYNSSDSSLSSTPRARYSVSLKEPGK